MSASALLPTEILEQIVDASKQNRRTLAACGTASRQLLARSRMHLFAAISLGSPRVDRTRRVNATYPSGTTRCDQLLELIDANPVLAEHIVDLTLHEGGYPNLTVYWISQSTTLLRLADLLCNLQSFSLRCGTDGEWSLVLLDTLRKCIARPSLQSVDIAALHVRDIEKLHAIFNSGSPGSTLARLCLIDTVFSGSQNPDASLHERHWLRVDTFEVSLQFEEQGHWSLLNILSSPFPLFQISSVRNLRISVGNESADLRKWIELTASSLEELELRFIGDRGASQPFGSALCAATENLRIFRCEVLTSNALVDLLSLLGALRAPNLEKVELQFRRPEHVYRRGDLSSIVAGAVDIAQSPSSPHVSRVRLDFGRVFPEEWRAQLLELCEGLDVYKNGVLELA